MRGRIAAWFVTAGLALGGARALRAVAMTERDAWPERMSEPFAPAPDVAPYVALGHRELLADMLWIRALVYLGSGHDTADGVAALVEGAQAADPYFQRIYTDGVHLMLSAHHGLEPSHALRAAQLAELGTTYFPQDFDITDLAGTVYSVRLSSKDPALQRAWREKGASLLERALRLPGATAEDASAAATLRTTLGEHERAVRELSELVLITNDPTEKHDMIEKLAELEKRDATAIEIALDDARTAFEQAWFGARPELPETMFVIVGPRPAPYIDFHALATDRDLVGSEPTDETALPPPDDDAPTTAGSGPRSP
jgi:hypothetical protein